MATATYTKLHSGDWGVRVEGAAKVGQQVTVRKKDGSTKVETIAKVIWSGNGVSICAVTESGTPGGGRKSSRRESGYCYYPCPVTGLKCCPENGPCHDCQ